MVDNKRDPLHSMRSEIAMRSILLLISSIGMCFLFWPQYDLYLHPIHTQADVIKLAPRSIDYKFYVPSIDKTLFFRRELQLHESKNLEGIKQLEIIYPSSNPDQVYIPLIQRPLPVWFYLGINLTCIYSFIISIKSFLKLRNTVI